MRYFILLTKILLALKRSDDRKKSRSRYRGVWDKASCNQKARMVAYSLKAFVAEGISNGKTNSFLLSKVTPFKTKVLGKSETPMFDSGALLKHLIVKKVRDCTYMVYWSDRRPYESSSLTAQQIVGFHKDRQSVKLTGQAKERWRKWFWTKVTKAGYTADDIKHTGGEAGRLTYRARPFWDRALKRFQTRFSGYSGIKIYTEDTMGMAAVIKVE